MEPLKLGMLDKVNFMTVPKTFEEIADIFAEPSVCKIIHDCFRLKYVSNLLDCFIKILSVAILCVSNAEL